MRIGRERRSARDRRAKLVRQRRMVILAAVLVVIPVVALAVLAGVSMMVDGKLVSTMFSQAWLDAMQ